MDRNMTRKHIFHLPLAAILLLAAPFCMAQDLEPRRWTPLPPGMSVVGLGAAYTSGAVDTDPVLLVEDADVTVTTLVASYVRAFRIGSHSARLDVILPRQDAQWSGLLDGTEQTVRRIGLADPRLRLSYLLYQSPPPAQPGVVRSTVVGAALEAVLPFGEYYDDKLLNLGYNRVTLRPQFGVLHRREKWSFELTGSAFLFGDDDDFRGVSTRSRDPLYAMQAHAVRSLNDKGAWLSVGAAYGLGGETQVDGVAKKDASRTLLTGFSFGWPVAKRQSVKFAYVRQRNNALVGARTTTLSLAWSMHF